MRNPPGFHRAGFINSGDVLLSHNLEMHYHWGCSVSLPCSEWERVGPLRSDHQKDGGRLFKAPASVISGDRRGFSLAGTGVGAKFLFKEHGAFPDSLASAYRRATLRWVLDCFLRVTFPCPPPRS